MILFRPSVFGLASQRAVRPGLFQALSDMLEVLSACVLTSFSRAELLQRLGEGEKGRGE